MSKSRDKSWDDSACPDCDMPLDEDSVEYENRRWHKGCLEDRLREAEGDRRMYEYIYGPND